MRTNPGRDVVVSSCRSNRAAQPIRAAQRRGRTWLAKAAVSALSIIGGLCLALILTGCDTEENPLAPYEGNRPLIVQNVTTSFSPDIAWVGGRVSAVGINRGERAALDSTLVWLHVANDNEIESPVYVREVLDESGVTKVGGTPTDSLEHGETYTLWIAEKEAYDAALSGAAIDAFAFADTTFTVSYLLRGRSAGGVGVQFTIFRDQRILSDVYNVDWTPAVPFRRVAIRNSTVGGFSDLLWHIVLPDSLPDSITPPLVIGAAPENAIEAVEWDGFNSGQHILWAATEDWDGESFGFRTEGYAFFSIFADNFAE